MVTGPFCSKVRVNKNDLELQPEELREELKGVSRTRCLLCHCDTRFSPAVLLVLMCVVEV